MRRSPLNPMSAKRRAMLAASGIAHPSTTLVTRTVTKPKRPTDTGPDQATVDACLERDSWSCVRCGGALHGRRGFDWSIHHRINRSQGGDNRLSNLLSLCGDGTSGCHGWVTAHPALAQDGGWCLLSTDLPAAKVVDHSVHGFVWLTDNGRVKHTKKGGSSDGD